MKEVTDPELLNILNSDYDEKSYNQNRATETNPDQKNIASWQNLLKQYNTSNTPIDPMGYARQYSEPERLATQLQTSFVAPSAQLKHLQQIPKAGKYLSSILGQGLTQAGIGAAFNPETALESGVMAGGIALPFQALEELISSGNPFLRSAAKLARTLGIAGLTREGLKGTTGSESLSNAGAALAATLSHRPNLNSLARKINKNRNNPELEESLLQAGRNLDVPVRPQEANPTWLMGKTVGNLGKTSEGGSLLAEKQTQALGREESSIHRLFDTMYNEEKLAPKLKQAYESAYEKPFNAKKIEHFKENENIKSAIKEIETEPAFKEEFKNLKSKDSLAYWDLVKRALDTKIGRETDITGKMSNPGRLTNRAKDALVEELDKIVPEYTTARELGQRRIVRENLEKLFNKKDFTAANMSGILKNKGLFEETLRGMKNVPEAQQQLRDMHLLFKHLGGKQLNAKAGEKMAQQNTSQIRNTYDAIVNVVNENLNGQYDKAAVELMFNPSWKEELHKLSQVTDREKLTAKFMNLLSKTVGQVGASEYE